MTATVACVGIAVHDLVFAVDGEPIVGSKNFASSVSVTAGGPAVNAALTVASLGGTAVMVSRVGDDVPGDLVMRNLETAGVDTSHIERVDGRSTPVSTVVVHGDGERTIVNFTDPGLVTAVGPSVDAAVERSDVVLTDVRWVAGARRALERAAAARKPAVVDFDLSDVADGRDLVALASHVVFSSDALLALDPSLSVRDGLTAVAGTTDAVVGVTLGPAGSLWMNEGRIVEVPALDVTVVSTLGAGDVFHGAFALAIGEGRPVLDAASFATATAAFWCTLGPGSGGRVTREDVDRMEGR